MFRVFYHCDHSSSISKWHQHTSALSHLSGLQKLSITFRKHVPISHMEKKVLFWYPCYQNDLKICGSAWSASTSISACIPCHACLEWCFPSCCCQCELAPCSLLSWAAGYLPVLRLRLACHCQCWILPTRPPWIQIWGVLVHVGKWLSLPPTWGVGVVHLLIWGVVHLSFCLSKRKKMCCRPPSGYFVVFAWVCYQ